MESIKTGNNRKSAEQGCAQAQYKYGWHVYLGIRTKKSREQGHEEAEKALKRLGF